MDQAHPAAGRYLPRKVGERKLQGKTQGHGIPVVEKQQAAPDDAVRVHYHITETVTRPASSRAGCGRTPGALAEANFFTP